MQVLSILSAALPASLLLCLGTSLAQTASEDSKPEKDKYWLCDPTPDTELRSFNTDRPTKSDVPYTVDAGHFQYETDLINYAHQQTGGVRTDTLLIPNPTLKLGLTNDTDVEVNIAFATLHMINGRMTRDISGPSDLFFRVKTNIWGNDGGSSAFGLIPFIRLPTAPAGLGNQAVEGGVIAPLSISLPDKFTLLFNGELDALHDNAGSGYHPNLIALANLSREIVKDVTLYAELWTDVNADPEHGQTQFSFDTAIAWKIQSNLQADLGLNIGLN